MGSDPVILAFDTSAAHCAAALLRGDAVLEARAEDMGRGQAERLFPLLEEVLASNGLGWQDLSRLGVGIGPGNFTGIRISVAAARGLALSLGVPAIGVSTFQAISMSEPAPHLPAVPAPRDQFYILPPGAHPRLATRPEVDTIGLPLRLPPEPARLAAAIGICAAAGAADAPAPAPLYVKPADAAPTREAPPPILADDR